MVSEAAVCAVGVHSPAAGGTKGAGGRPGAAEALLGLARVLPGNLAAGWCPAQNRAQEDWEEAWGVCRWPQSVARGRKGLWEHGGGLTVSWHWAWVRPQQRPVAMAAARAQSSFSEQPTAT